MYAGRGSTNSKAAGPFQRNRRLCLSPYAPSSRPAQKGIVGYSNRGQQALERLCPRGFPTTHEDGPVRPRKYTTSPARIHAFFSSSGSLAIFAAPFARLKRQTLQAQTAI